MKEFANMLQKQADDLKQMIEDTSYPPKIPKWDWLKPKDFKEYLQGVFMDDEPESVGDKDSFEDNFDNWLVAQDPMKIVELAELWGKEIFPEDLKK